MSFPQEVWFQHTAARRRLVNDLQDGETVITVSTHSRPKAAGARLAVRIGVGLCFNTQPPEGGWIPDINLAINLKHQFQHTAARRRLG